MNKEHVWNNLTLWLVILLFKACISLTNFYNKFVKRKAKEIEKINKNKNMIKLPFDSRLG